MSENDRIILDKIIEQKRKEIGAGLSPQEFFEYFTAEQILKIYDLSYDEIKSGIVDGGGDGQIDSAYFFVNGELILEDTDVTAFKKDVVIDLVIIQSKTAKGFEEGVIDKLKATLDELLDLSKDIQALAPAYNKAVIEVIGRFRSLYEDLASKFPKLRFRICYATRGQEPSENMVRKATNVSDGIRKLFKGAEATFEFFGANELLALARQSGDTVFTLTLAETPISSESQSFICLVRLVDYHAFIKDANSKLRRGMFEANVRDYQGDVQVNTGIKETLRGDRKEDFWWLNNGVTIVATKVSHTGKALTIENPNIVNGLQTSTEIFNYFAAEAPKDERNILVRVIVPESPQSRDRIIKATNSQTYIPAASLRATEAIHRNIEDYLGPYQIFYDRRKNFYKNEGKPIERIISISQLAQAIMSTVLQRPNDARARPSSLLNDPVDYEQVFNAKHPIELYRICAGLLKRTEGFLRSDSIALSTREQNNLKFYVLMHVTGLMAKDSRPRPEAVSKLDLTLCSDILLTESLDIVSTIYVALGETDQVAKSADMTEVLKADLVKRFPKDERLIAAAESSV